ncbi:glycosyltransferase [Photobacterium profundum]|uniref:glycosyltransferase family 2 protein n=1 Tax=Photobacterium profundum TaxID=74109 RepID=UPI003D12257D
MINNERVSIIMPCYNAAETIRDSLISALNQTYTDFEIIICDDSSSDESVNIIKSFQDERIKVVKNSFSKGAAGARNSALEHVTGRYVCFLDSDDLWSESKLNIQLEHMKESDSAMSYGDYFIFEGSVGNIIGLFNPPKAIGYNELKRKCDIGCLTVMLDRNKIDNIIMPNCYKEDYATWLLLLKRGIIATKYKGEHAFYRKGNNSLSSNKLIEIKRQFLVLNEICGINVLSCIYYTSLYVVNGIFKHIYVYKNKRKI